MQVLEQVKLEELAGKFGITSEHLRQYLYEELTPLQATMVLKGKEL